MQKNLFDRRAKFLGVVYQRPVRSYDINGKVINKNGLGISLLTVIVIFTARNIII